jgi:hypothetical protein
VIAGVGVRGGRVERGETARVEIGVVLGVTTTTVGTYCS